MKPLPPLTKEAEATVHYGEGRVDENTPFTEVTLRLRQRQGVVQLSHAEIAATVLNVLRTVGFEWLELTAVEEREEGQ